MLSVKDKLTQLDNMILEGHVIDAFEKFFADNVITHSDSGDRSKDKKQKRAWLEEFFSMIQTVDKIELHGQRNQGNVTHSDFTFKFTTVWGAPLVWKEIIRRTWKNGEVVDEYYYTGDLPPEKAVATKKVAKTQKVTTTKKVVATRKKKDDLKKIEGIGPKIEQILQKAGITTFANLAATSPTKIKKLLAEAGKRFQMHNPTTWPEQSKLAKAGKWDELKRWQDELKGGK